MKRPKVLAFPFYFLFLAALCFVCFRAPLSEEFDRYVYEAIVRGKQQTVEVIYPIVKHSTPRAEASSIMDSPEHLGQLEPLYAIRPLYLEAIAVVARTGMPYQPAISLVSAASLFLIGSVLLVWTGRPLYSGLLLAAPAVVGIARSGTPDALAAFFLLTSAWALTKNRTFPGVTLLLASVWVRTDNVLFVLVVLIWLLWTKRVSPFQFVVLAALAGTSVLAINHFSGNYGWRVLFRYTFVGERYIAYVRPNLRLSEYLAALAGGVKQIGNQETALFVLLGLAAIKWLPRTDLLRPLLICVGAAAIWRFLLFPNPEDRYFAWAYLIAGTAFIQALAGRSGAGALSSGSAENDVSALERPQA
jgi:hypothetical protein